MWNPRYAISPKLLRNIKQITTVIADLNNRVVPRIIFFDFERRAREVSAYASTSIEGNPLPLTEVKRILKQQPLHIRDSEKEVLNYNRILTELNKEISSKKGAIFDKKNILHIQKEVTKGLISPFHNGKLRKEPVVVNDPRQRRVIYLPPDHKDVPGLMNELIQFIHTNEDILDPLIIAGIFHRQFVIIHPFIDGNGRTARLATKVVLAKMGLDTFNLFSFENYYNKNISQYFEYVGLKGNYYDINATIDFTEWLEYFTDGIIDELLRVKKELESIGNTSSHLEKHHIELLLLLLKRGTLTDREYTKHTDRAKPTRNTDFNKLINLGLIERKGKGKASYYIFSDLQKWDVELKKQMRGAKKYTSIEKFLKSLR